MTSPLEWIGAFLVASGVAFSLVGSVGLNRLPDFYTRAHAATKPDTLGLFLCMSGLVFLNLVDFELPRVVVIAKLIVIVIVVAVANPAAAHALGRSALRTGVQPWCGGLGDRPGGEGEHDEAERDRSEEPV